jgi:hypothetical protein
MHTVGRPHARESEIRSETEYRRPGAERCWRGPVILPALYVGRSRICALLHPALPCTPPKLTHRPVWSLCPPLLVSIGCTTLLLEILPRRLHLPLIPRPGHSTKVYTMENSRGTRRLHAYDASNPHSSIQNGPGPDVIPRLSYCYF